MRSSWRSSDFCHLQWILSYYKQNLRHGYPLLDRIRTTLLTCIMTHMHFSLSESFHIHGGTQVTSGEIKAALWEVKQKKKIQTVLRFSSRSKTKSVCHKLRGRQQWVACVSNVPCALWSEERQQSMDTTSEHYVNIMNIIMCFVCIKCCNGTELAQNSSKSVVECQIAEHMFILSWAKQQSHQKCSQGKLQQEKMAIFLHYSKTILLKKICTGNNHWAIYDIRNRVR